MLAVPQIIKNYRNKNCEGLSNVLVACWLLGDVFKTLYFFLTFAPMQLKLCGLTQIILDLVVVYQIKYYHGKDLEHNLELP